MSTYYYLACDECEECVPFWAQYAGGSGTIRTAKEFPDTIDDFIHRHYKCTIRAISEHELDRFDYADALDGDPRID